MQPRLRPVTSAARLAEQRETIRPSRRLSLANGMWPRTDDDGREGGVQIRRYAHFERGAVDKEGGTKSTRTRANSLRKLVLQGSGK